MSAGKTRISTNRSKAGRPRDKAATRALLIGTVGKMLSEQGFAGLGVNALAKAAGVDKVLIYRYFGGLPGLIDAFGRESDFWPGIVELTGGDPVAFQQLSLEEKLCTFGRNFLAGIRKRPLTQEIMAWEMVARNPLTLALQEIRERRMLQFAEMYFPHGRKEVDLLAVSAVIGAGISYLVCRSRGTTRYNGVDLGTAEGWLRIEAAIVQLVKGTTTLLMAENTNENGST